MVMGVGASCIRLEVNFDSIGSRNCRSDGVFETFFFFFLRCAAPSKSLCTSINSVPRPFRQIYLKTLPARLLAHLDRLVDDRPSRVDS